LFAKTLAWRGRGRDSRSHPVRLRDRDGHRARLKTGTNCGSCVPELKALLAQHVVKKIA